MVAGLGGDVIASRVLRMSRYLGHTDSQSEKAKAGAVNLASTNRPFTNWRSKMHGKRNLVNRRLTSTIKLIGDYVIKN